MSIIDSEVLNLKFKEIQNEDVRTVEQFIKLSDDVCRLWSQSW